MNRRTEGLAISQAIGNFVKFIDDEGPGERTVVSNIDYSEKVGTIFTTS